MTGLEKWNKTQNASQTIKEAVDTIIARDHKSGFHACDWCCWSGYYCGGTDCENGVEMYLEDEVEE